MTKGSGRVLRTGLSQAEPCSTVSALTGFDPSRKRQYWERPFGTAGDAIDWVCGHLSVSANALWFLDDWRAAGADTSFAERWPEYMHWLKVQQDCARASAIEARRAETGNTDSVACDESATAESRDAQP